MTTAREREREREKKKTATKKRKRSSHTLFADNSIFKQRVKNSEINRLRKTKSK
jgi:hypothetical protein